MIHGILAGVKEGDDWIERQVNASGAHLLASGTVIDKDGNVSSWGVWVTGDGKDGRFASSRKSREELVERLAEKKKEAKAREQERQEEKQKSEETAADSLEANLTIEVAEKRSSSAPASPGTLDVKA